MPKKCKIIQPEYVKYFKCSANNCENDTCCSGWMIYVDKNAYDKCKNIKETEIRKKIDQALLFKLEGYILTLIEFCILTVILE